MFQQIFGNLQVVHLLHIKIYHPVDDDTLHVTPGVTAWGSEHQHQLDEKSMKNGEKRRKKTMKNSWEKSVGTVGKILGKILGKKLMKN